MSNAHTQEEAGAEQTSTPLTPELVNEFARQKKVPVVEIFGPTIQGEGPLIGTPTHFIRLGLCDYKCVMCDSMHAVDPKQVSANAKWLTQQEIFTEFCMHADPTNVKMVTLSGGNPCIHNLEELTRALRAYNYQISIETQGTFSPSWLVYCDHITVSPKGPGMGEALELPKLDEFIRDWGHRCTLKFILFDQRDVEVAAMLYERYCIPAVMGANTPLHNPQQFVLSLGNPHPPGHPNYGSEEQLQSMLLDLYRHMLAELQKHPILCNVRFLPQLHVLLWGNKQAV